MDPFQTYLGIFMIAIGFIFILLRNKLAKLKMHIIPKSREECIKEPYSSIGPSFYLVAGIIEIIVGVFLLLVPLS